MKDNNLKPLAVSLQEAQTCLDQLAADPEAEPDLEQLHRAIADLTPYYNPDASPDLVRTMARLYFASTRYAECAEALQRLEDPALDEMRALCDFHNAYYTTPQDWALRFGDIWYAFLTREEDFSGDSAQVSRALSELKQDWDPLIPSLFVMTAPPYGREKGKILLSNLHGVFSLIPMLYLASSVPVSRWSLLLEDKTVSLNGFTLLGQKVRVQDILVQVLPSPLYPGTNRVRFQVWHPFLAEMAATSGLEDFAADLAAHTVNLTLSPTAGVLYVEQITVAQQPPAKGQAIPLSEMRDWFQARQLPLDIPIDQIMAYRGYRYTRTPTAIPRPRADIVRGETMMPELEEIYFLRDSKAMATLQRYGLGYWFLTIPKAAVGKDFYRFRIKLPHRAISECAYFIGWAEGTQNYYIDFVSVQGREALDTLHTYFQTLPGGEDIRICSFYWNSVLRTLDYEKEIQFTPTEPPKEQVSPEDRAALEQAFRETRWHNVPVQDFAPFGYEGDGEDEDEEMDEDLNEAFLDRLSHSGSIAQLKDAFARISEALPDDLDDDDDEEEEEDGALEQLEETADYIEDSNETDAPLDYVRLHNCILAVLSAADPADMEEEDQDRLGLVLVNAERFRESARLASLHPSDHQYTCDVGSSYPKFFHQWEPRRKELWMHFSAVESALTKQLSGSRDSDSISDLRLWADSVFPSQELTLLPGPKGKNTLLTGLPDGILTLPAMLYLTGNYPANLGKRWKIAISGDGDSVPSFVPVGRFSVPSREVRVSLAREGGKVSLALWHPKLAQVAKVDSREAQDIAVRLVNCALPIGARLLSVEKITAVPEASEDSFALPDLQQQMESAGLQTDISLDALLTRRRYTISREPKNTGRPRDDILRGETCMPELDRIYYRLYEEGQTILERYGCNALFLMIPRERCGGDPAPFLQQLRSAIRQAEGDKVFFTGWAEGTAYCYLDLITLHGCSLLSLLNEYAYSGPQGKVLQFATFYWDSKPFSWLKLDAYQQMATPDPADMKDFIPAHKFPRVPVPDAETAAALEASFHPEFTLADFCAPKQAEGAAQAAQKPAVGKKKLSKAQRKAQNAKNNKKKR